MLSYGTSGCVVERIVLDEQTLLKIHSRMTAAVFALLMSTVTYQSESVVTTIRTLSDTAEMELEESGVDTVGDCKTKKNEGKRELD
jgi:hypothetical protein